VLAASDLATAVVSSAVVAAIVGSASSFFTQRYLLVRKAQIDAGAMDRQARIEYESMARAAHSLRQTHPSVAPASFVVHDGLLRELAGLPPLLLLSIT
jgi:hypothetical protein